MNDVNINGWLDELGQKFYDAITDKFQIVNADHEIVEIKVPTKYGYKYDKETVTYKLSDYTHTEDLKWGFIGKEIEFRPDPSRSFRPEYILPDREAMDEIVQKSYDEFDAYVHATLAKMALLGFDKIYYPLAKDPKDKYKFQYAIDVDDSCISEKGNCVTHILLKPIFVVAKEEERGGSPF